MGLSACSPPLIIFIIGTGRIFAVGPPTYRYSDRLQKSAAALAQASEMPSIALAPKRDLLGVPSISIIAASIDACSVTSYPTNASANSPLTAATALSTPFPLYRFLSASLFSAAS